MHRERANFVMTVVKGGQVATGQPERFDDVARSLASGKIERNATTSGSICDAIVTPQPGNITFPIMVRLCGKGIAVTEEEALRAMVLAFNRLKIVVEPGGAVALAAALYDSSPQNQAEALQLAEKALAADPNYVNESFQKEQLWGPKLRATTSRLLAQPALKAAVERASANAGGSSDEDGEQPRPPRLHDYSRAFMKIWMMYQNISAIEENNASAAAT